MSESIIDLCRSLPDSEPELRARALDFTRAVCVRVMGWQEVADVSEIPSERMGDTIYFEPFAGIVGDVSGSDVGSVLVYAGGDAYKFNPMVYIADAKAATDAMTGRGCGHYMREIYDGRRRLVRWRIYFPHGQMIDLERYAEAAALTEELARPAACVLAAEAMRQSAK